MKPIRFPGQNVEIGKNQPEYQTLPALVLPDKEGTVITCWEFTDEEIHSIVENRKMYLQQLTFGGRLQPIKPIVELSDDITLI